MKSIFAHLVISVFALICSVSLSSAAIYTISPNGITVREPAATTLAQASTAATLAGKTVYVSSAYTVTTSITWPADRKLEITKGGMLIFSGAGSITFADKSAFSAGSYQVFSGTAVTFGKGVVEKVNVLWFGAYNDGTNAATTTAAINAAIESIGAVGGIVRAPMGTYKVSPITGSGIVSGSANLGVNCVDVWIKRNNIIFEGDGWGTVFSPTNDTDSVINVSGTIPLYSSTTGPSGVVLRNFRVEGLNNAHYDSLEGGRGIQITEGSKDIEVTGVSANRMPMYGIHTLGTVTNVRIHHNSVDANILAGIGMSGSALGSRITDNTVTGPYTYTASTTGWGNTSGIEPEGDVMVSNNFIAYYGNGIQFGENNEDYFGIASNNYIRRVNNGINVLYFGPVNIVGNTIINAANDGIILSNSVYSVSGPTFNEFNRNNNISGNYFINNSLDIDVAASGTNISGNTSSYISSNNSTQTTLIITRPTAFVRATGDNISITGNIANSPHSGILYRFDKVMGAISSNNFTGTDQYGISLTGTDGYANQAGFVSILADTQTGASSVKKVFHANSLSAVIGAAGDEVRKIAPAASASPGWVAVANVSTVTTATVSSGTTITMVTTGVLAGDVIAIMQDNGAVFFSTVASVTDGTHLVTSDAVASTITSGKAVWTTRWKATAALAA